MIGQVSKVEIAVPSIMHSGTHVLRYQILKAHFQEDDKDTCFFNGNSKNKMHGFHVDQAHRFESQLHNCKIFSPLRHPRRVARSFKSRERAKSRMPYIQQNVYNQFDIMSMLDKRFDIIYLHVDAPEVRDLEVELMAWELNLPLEKNFEVCRRSGSVAGNHDIPLDNCPEVPDKYINFYYETIERMRELHGRR